MEFLIRGKCLIQVATVHHSRLTMENESQVELTRRRLSKKVGLFA